MRTRSIPALTTIIAISLIITTGLLYSCSKKSPAQEQEEEEIPTGNANVSAQTSTVFTYQVANLIVKNGFSERYSGTFGSVPVDLVRTSDTTLSFLVPEVAEGKQILRFPIGNVSFTVTKSQVADPEKVVTDLVKTLDTQISNLTATNPDEVAEVNSIKQYKQEVLALYNTLTTEQKRQTALFYEANKATFRAFSAGVYTNIDAPTSLRQSDCPRTDFRSFYGCTADNLATAAIALKNSSVEFLKLLALAGVSAYLAPASFGLSAISTTLAAGMAGYLLITEIRPAAITFRRALISFLGANWIFTKGLFLTIKSEFETGISVNLNLDAYFKSVYRTDGDVNEGTSHFISALASLQLYWDRLTAVFGYTPGYVGTKKSFDLSTTDYTITGISNPNVQLVTRSNENVTFKSLSGKEESFSFHIKVSKEGFTEEKDVSARVIAISDSSAIYKAACVGGWTVYGYDPNNPTTTYTLELFADGTGKYHVPNSSTTYGTSWEVRRNNANEYRLYESGFWHPAYDELTRDKLEFPPSSFKTYANFDQNFVSQKYIKN